MFLKWWLQENELAIAGYQEIEHLLIAVPSGKSFTNQQSEVACQRRFGNHRSIGFGKPCSATRATGSVPAIPAQSHSKLRPAAPPARDPQ